MKNITPVIAAQTRAERLPPETPGRLWVSIRQLRALGFLSPGRRFVGGQIKSLVTSGFRHTFSTYCPNAKRER
jgi:hypothetical protein